MVLLVAGGLLLILSILGFMHTRRVPPDTEVLSKTTTPTPGLTR